jgi:putative membrane protein
MEYTDLPFVNAILNSITTVLLVAGFIAVKSGNKDLHRKIMIAALTTSTVFLIGYLTHKFTVGPTKFTGEGSIRTVYFTILITHTILAIVNLPLIIWAVVLAAKGNFEKHMKVTRWAYPIWLYVSVTGVLVYLFLYQWFG